MDSSFQRIKPVNIRQVFHEKNPRIAQILPGFVYRYLEKIVRQKDVNDFLAAHGDKYGLDFVRAAIKDFNVKVKLYGKENLCSKGRYIFASNHPLGGFDGLLLMNELSPYYKDFKFIVNDILMKITNLHPLFIPVNKHGRQGAESAVKLEELYSSDAQVLTFPSGYVSRKFGPQVMDLVWKKNFIHKAVQHHRDIIPVFISGENSRFFYRLYKTRKFLGIKTNLEMFYLVDETWKHKNKNFAITMGKPIPYTTFDKSKSLYEWAKWVKEQCYALGGVTKIPL
ncbi:MAG: 1-acyl-sn-glycerol-3-phosphate acyltransferase [Bacteroidales bacterium]|nr:1-acyl-sn-glycerol-3-phosphate acyltransferase [Bacteroidales bacterium]MBN2761827.1 1-acyl-sn-glycerol-3-phosphate acyltransferase [Bacteroidales bacterium]